LPISDASPARPRTDGARGWFVATCGAVMAPPPGVRPKSAARPDRGSTLHRSRGKARASLLSLARKLAEGGSLEHDPEKWAPVFGKDHAPTISARQTLASGVFRFYLADHLRLPPRFGGTAASFSIRAANARSSAGVGCGILARRAGRAVQARRRGSCVSILSNRRRSLMSLRRPTMR
jgi:hypothetical protein